MNEQSTFRKTVLKNGIRVVSESHSNYRSVSLGIFCLTGTRDEAHKFMGISHLTEHMVFKGTKKRSAFQIARSLEALGGELNAYTSREYTCYHALVLKDHWAKALDVLSDLVSNMSVSKRDFEREKSVVMQEIAMSEDTHEELIYDKYFENTYRGSMGWPILGTEESLDNIGYRDLNNYFKSRYTGSQIIVSAAGNIDHDELVAKVKELLGKKTKRKTVPKRKKVSPRPFKLIVDKASEQIHLLVGFEATSYRSPYRFEAFIANTLLGGGMTSKLYQSVREKKGLAYSIYSSLNTFADSGVITIYAGTEKKYVTTLLQTIKEQIQKVKANGISESDLELFKTQVKGAILLGTDDVENRMTSLAVNEMVFGKYKSVDEVIAEIDHVTAKSVNEYLKKYLKLDKMGVLLLGGDASEFTDYLREY